MEIVGVARVFDALLFGKQGLEGVSSVTRVGWAGCDLSGGLSGCICAVLCGRSRLWAWPECNFDDHVPNQGSIREFHGIL